jgi:hypothetical protein
MARMIPAGRGAIALAAVLTVLALAAGGARAQEPGAGEPTSAREAELEPIVKVERVEAPRPKDPTLRFLAENRDFFRARLDLLRTSLGPRVGGADDLDPRFLRWREMLAEIGAGRDSTAATAEWIRRRELLDSVGDLVALEAALDSIEARLDAQGARLVELEEDFTGRQRTALVVLLTGVPAGGAPTGVVLEDPDGDDWRIELDDADRRALARGGTVELAHRLVEPRAHSFVVRLESGAEVLPAPWTLAVEPERDRLTFVELDLDGLDPAAASVLPARAWTR